MAENGVSSTEGKIPSRLGRDLQFNLELDVSEALTGLKAVQREAKEAVKALKELETIQMNKDIKVDFSNWGKSKSGKQFGIERFSREELIDELKRRGRNQKIYPETVHKGGMVKIYSNDGTGLNLPTIWGVPCEVIVITD